MFTDSQIINDFIFREIADCNERGIKVNLAPTQFLLFNGTMQTSGWFDEESLQVAIGKPVSDWLPTFVHESCHKDQFVEKAEAWNTKIKTYDCLDILDMWLDEVCELTTTQLEEVITKAQAVEFDCEKRTLEKMRDNKLPVDLENYTKRANVYMWFYRTIPITRKWYPAPYENPKLVSLMPNHFDNDYSRLPEGFLETMLEHYPKG